MFACTHTTGSIISPTTRSNSRSWLEMLYKLSPPPPRHLNQWRRRATAAPLVPGPCRKAQMVQRSKNWMTNPAIYCPPPTTPRWTRISPPSQRRRRATAVPLAPGPRRETQMAQRPKIWMTTQAIHLPPLTTPRWTRISPPPVFYRSSRRFRPHNVRGLGSGRHDNPASRQVIITVALKDKWVQQGAGKNVW